MARKFPVTDLYAITNSHLALGRSIEELGAALLQASIKLIQYREKGKNAKQMLAECEVLRRLTREAGATFIVNDFPSLALLADADGVHVGQEDFSVASVRELIGPERIIGVSTHGPEQAVHAIADGADYIAAGPIYVTETKKDICPPVGLEYLRYIASSCPIPFVAIGGIKLHNIREVVEAGGGCCCLISEIVGVPDISSRVLALRKRMGSRA